MAKQIVLIDDDPINNLILKKEISKKDGNIELLIFEAAQDALDYLKKATIYPNLILLDINMPEVSGWEVLDYLESEQIQIPVFMITSSVVKRDQEKAKDFKLIQDYLIKPLSAENFDKIAKSIS